MNLEIPAEFYYQVRQYLRAGDYMLAVATRDNGAENPVSTGRVQTAIQQLNSFTDTRIRKVIVFSANDDLSTWLASVPSDVALISYNAEGGLSPASEVGSPAALQTAAISFADTVNANGRESHFAPTSSVYNTLQNQDRLATILGSMKGAVFQSQNYLSTVTETAFLSEMRTRADYVHAVAGARRYGIQLSAALQTADQIARIFKDLWVAVDFGTILANSASDDSVLIQVLKELRPLAGGRRPPRSRNLGGMLQIILGRLEALIKQPRLIWTPQKFEPPPLRLRASIREPYRILDMQSVAQTVTLRSGLRPALTARLRARMLALDDARAFREQDDLAAILAALGGVNG